MYKDQFQLLKDMAESIAGVMNHTNRGPLKVEVLTGDEPAGDRGTSYSIDVTVNGETKLYCKCYSVHIKNEEDRIRLYNMMAAQILHNITSLALLGKKIMREYPQSYLDQHPELAHLHSTDQEI